MLNAFCRNVIFNAHGTFLSTLSIHSFFWTSWTLWALINKRKAKVGKPQNYIYNYIQYNPCTEKPKKCTLMQWTLYKLKVSHTFTTYYWSCKSATNSELSRTKIIAFNKKRKEKISMATDSTIILTFLLPLGISLILILFVIFGFIRVVCSSSEALHHQHMHEVITQKCNRKSKECYSILDGNIIKISCPVCVQNEVNSIFVWIVCIVSDFYNVFFDHVLSMYLGKYL